MRRQCKTIEGKNKNLIFTSLDEGSYFNGKGVTLLKRIEG
jgi:hypothetical protein